MVDGLAAVALGVAWLCGVFVGGQTPVSLVAAASLAVSAVALGVAARQLRPIAFGTAPFIGLTVAALVLGAWRAGAVARPGADDLASRNGQVVSWRGTVDADPTPRGRSIDLTLHVDSARVGAARPAASAGNTVGAGSAEPGSVPAVGSWQPASGRVLVRLDSLAPVVGASDENGGGLEAEGTDLLSSEVRLGDRLELTGRLDEPISSDSFDYRTYLARQGIQARAEFPAARLLDRGHAPAALLALGRLRAGASETLSRLIAEPAGALAQGILLGERAGLPPSVLESFARTNTTHIIAISGMNIALVIGLLQPLTSRLPGRWLRLAIVVLGIAVYTALVGAQASVVRAALMGSLVAWAKCLGRPSDGLTGLALTAVAMTALDPAWIYDLGFELSFLATLGLVLLAPTLEDWLHWLPGWLRSSLALTLAAQAATLPILAITFGQISPITPLANLLVVPVLGPATATGVVAIGLGAIWQPLGALAGWLTWALLTYMIGVVEWAAALPTASLPLGPIAPGLVALWYIGVLALVLASRASPLPNARGWLATAWSRLLALAGPTRLALALAAVAVVVWASALVIARPAPLVTFLDVGQGDAILIQTRPGWPGGRTVLVDGGPDPVAITNALGRRLPFWSRRIDLVVLSHPHDDHVVGLIEVLDRYEVGAVLESGATVDSPAAARWRDLVAEKSLPRLLARAGLRVDLGDGVELEVLHPGEVPVRGTKDETNDNSVVLRLRHGQESLYLLGDAGPAAQREILARAELGAPLPSEARLLKAPHHGAANSLDDGFISRLAPGVAIVSVGQRNRFGHPATSTLEQLRSTRIFRTDVNGSVSVWLAEGGLKMESQR